MRQLTKSSVSQNLVQSVIKNPDAFDSTWTLEGILNKDQRELKSGSSHNQKNKKIELFWTAATKKAWEKGEICLGKKRQVVQKAKIDYLDRIDDLNTPFLLSDNEI